MRLPSQLLEIVCVAFEPMAVEDVFSIAGMASLSQHARSNILAKLSAVLATMRGKFVPYVLWSGRGRAHVLSCSSLNSVAACFAACFAQCSEDCGCMSSYHAALTSWLIDNTRAGMFCLTPLDGHRSLFC